VSRSSSVIVVHGGAFDIPREERDAHRDGCHEAMEAGWTVLAAGGSALDAVEGALRLMEDSGIFGAGRGSSLNEDGTVELDAGIMDGTDLAVGSVAAVQGVPHPVTLARRVLESEFAVVVGHGAARFAERTGVERCDSAELISDRERRRWEERRSQPDPDWAVTMFGARGGGDTVGAVALDFRGNVAAATSTGGAPFKPSGRVGDSPLIGAGLYADNATGAVSTTGHGERIIPVVLAKRAADMMSALHPQAAVERALATLGRVDGLGGLIAVDRHGRVGVAWNTPTMAFALRSSDEASGRVERSGPA